MNIVECEGNEAFAQAASNWCKENVERFKARSIFLPAGNTPEPLYQLWETERPAFLKELRFLQIDDVLTGSQSGVFRLFFETRLPDFKSQLSFIEAANECADLAMLGLGLNGHVAFHEPGVEKSFYSGCVRLSEVTCRNLKLEAGTWGVTYGAGAFERAKALLMMVKGSSKREILKRLLDGDPQLPATALIDHPRFTLLADREALG